MATNLFYGYPDIPFNATTITPSNTYSTTEPVTNLINGSRSKIGQLATATTGLTSIEFDLGSGVTQSANYFALLNAKILKSSGVTTVTLKGSNGAPATIATFSLASVTLTGGQGRDYITTFAATTAYRYWTVEFTSASSSTRPVSKIYIGTLCDLGRDPQFSRNLESEFYQDKAIYEGKKVSLEYQGITTTNRQTFETKIGKYRDVNEVLLYANSYDNVVAGAELMSAKILDYEFTTKGARTNDLRIDLEESY